MNIQSKLYLEKRILVTILTKIIAFHGVKALLVLSGYTNEKTCRAGETVNRVKWGMADRAKWVKNGRTNLAREYGQGLFNSVVSSKTAGRERKPPGEIWAGAELEVKNGNCKGLRY